MNSTVAVARLPAGRSATVSTHHHGSHRNLLHRNESAGWVPRPLDAIVVPTARPAAYLKPAIGLAARLNCPLIVLCSRWANARRAMRLGRNAGIEMVAIDYTDELAEQLLPWFRTSRLLAGTRFERRTDTSGKRNLALLLANVAGWERIAFLDDDITVPRPEDLLDAAGLLDHYAGVGLDIGGYPDNSVVCHANRESGGFQDVFVGGGALVAARSTMSSFFPNVYNEDWFFLLDEERLRSTAVTGTVRQNPYNPFATPDRARNEEFGDCLAEGVFWLLDRGRRVRDADVGFWWHFLCDRRAFIDLAGGPHPVAQARRIVCGGGGNLVAAGRSGAGEGAVQPRSAGVRPARAAAGGRAGSVAARRGSTVSLGWRLRRR